MQKPGQPISYYDVLQIAAHASDEEVKLAYRALAMKFHPDRNPSDRRMAELRFRLINEAYANLKTRDKRERYNRALRAQRKKIVPTKAQNDNNAPQSAGGFWTALAQLFWPQDSKSAESR